MKKLNTRQIIILAVTAIAVLYAGYEFLIAGPAAKKAGKATAPIEEMLRLPALTSDIMSNKATEPMSRGAESGGPVEQKSFVGQASYAPLPRRKRLKALRRGPNRLFRLC
jgi:hypothetical protein